MRAIFSELFIGRTEQSNLWKKTIIKTLSFVMSISILVSFISYKLLWILPRSTEREIFTSHVVIVVVSSLIGCLSSLFCLFYIVNNLNNILNELSKEDPNWKNLEQEYMGTDLYQLYGSIKKLHNNSAKKSKLEAIGQMSQMIFHDLRRPFSHIKLFLSTFEILKTNPKEIEKIKEEINKSIKETEVLLSDLLEFTKQTPIQLEDCSLSDIINHSLKYINIPSDKYNVSVFHSLKNKHLLNADAFKLSRAFTNIIENAKHAINKEGETKNGFIKISSEDVFIDNAQFIRTSISNNGPLLENNDLSKLFDPFFTTGKKNGVGLGLAIVKNIITLHNGKIEAKNTEEGVLFIIDIPASDKLDLTNNKVLCN